MVCQDLFFVRVKSENHTHRTTLYPQRTSEQVEPNENMEDDRTAFDDLIDSRIHSDDSDVSHSKTRVSCITLSVSYK